MKSFRTPAKGQPAYCLSARLVFGNISEIFRRNFRTERQRDCLPSRTFVEGVRQCRRMDSCYNRILMIEVVRCHCGSL